MIRFSEEKVLLLHQMIIAETGGANEVRDFGLLDSALASAFATWDGNELYPSKEEKGARIGCSLISNHAFVDGNKRIGMYIMLTFLEVNGIHLDCSNDDVVHAGLSVAHGSLQYEGLLAWIHQHKR
ncbi:MAG TPA: type II toxin-antitoxin system death-on-curing family toxin [Clostridiales bacterium]|nr:type II toxin-antitoxin system death-on-curing family toxin [Clostridiales bacterium]